MNGFIRGSACIPVEGVGRHKHSFGGTLSRPVIPPGCSVPCHLLYTIDTEDPMFPVRIDGVRYLPLIYCQQYNAAAISYRVEGESIIVDWIESLDWDKDFPYENYPSEFPRRDIVLRPVDLEFLRKEEEADVDTDTNVSRFGEWHWLCQGVPDVKCRNPQCGTGRMDVFGVVYNEPVPGVRLWDPDEDWSDVETIYQICSACASIQVCNRCT